MGVPQLCLYAECHLILVFRLKDLYKPVMAEGLSWQPVSRIWLRDTFLFGLHVFLKIVNLVDNILF